MNIEHKNYTLIEYRKYYSPKICLIIWLEILQEIIEYHTFQFLIDSSDVDVIAPKNQESLTQNITPQIEIPSEQDKTYNVLMI